MPVRTLQQIDAQGRAEALYYGVPEDWVRVWMRLHPLGGVSPEEEKLLADRAGPLRELAAKYRVKDRRRLSPVVGRQKS